MSREIKFRVWDKKKEKMQFVSKARDFDWLGNVLEEPERYKVMQFTGLKDKNGKEIYEGDIVQQRTNKRAPEIGEISWRKSAASFTVIWPKENNWYTLELLASSLEVIGNIYENSELLK